MIIRLSSIPFLFFLAASVFAQPPDLVILNARIHTVESKKVRKGGIAIRDGKILKIDHTYKIRDMMGRYTKRLDARQRLVIPGFNDSHTHFAGIGNLFSSMDLRNIRNAREIPLRIAEYVKYLPKTGGYLAVAGTRQNGPTNVL